MEGGEDTRRQRFGKAVGESGKRPVPPKPRLRPRLGGARLAQASPGSFCAPAVRGTRARHGHEDPEQSPYWLHKPSVSKGRESGCADPAAVAGAPSAARTPVTAAPCAPGTGVHHAPRRHRGLGRCSSPGDSHDAGPDPRARVRQSKRAHSAVVLPSCVEPSPSSILPSMNDLRPTQGDGGASAAHPTQGAERASPPRREAKLRGQAQRSGPAVAVVTRWVFDRRHGFGRYQRARPAAPPAGKRPLSG